MGQIHPDVWENKGGRVEPGTEENTKQTFSLCSEGVWLMQQPAPSTKRLKCLPEQVVLCLFIITLHKHIYCAFKRT